jgi:hypothetical protein
MINNNGCAPIPTPLLKYRGLERRPTMVVAQEQVFKEGFVTGWIEYVGSVDKTKLRQIAEAATRLQKAPIGSGRRRSVRPAA